MSEPAVLIATAKLRPGVDAEFSAWKARHDTIIGKFHGFVSSDIIPPPQPGGNEWTILLNFASREDVIRWQRSPERASILAEGTPLFDGGNLGEILQLGGVGERADTSVTEVVFSKIRAGKEDLYREWTARIQAAQATYPGYKGMFLQPPDGNGDIWTTIIRFDSASHLEAWMNSPERKKLLGETEDFIEHEQLTRLATSFPGWVPVDPATGKGPPNWKTAMLVLLGLFPVVMLEIKFLSPILSALALHGSLATFIGNAISVAITSFLTMPWCVKWFGWWLFPKTESGATTSRGTLILAALYTLEIIALCQL